MEEQVVNQRFDLFLWRVGGLLAILGLAGYLFLGPTADSSILQRWFYFDYNQNLLHLVAAVVALLTAWKGGEMGQRVVAASISVLALGAGAMAIYRAAVFAPNLWVLHISSPWEALFYIVLGLWGLWVVLMPAGPVFVRDQN